MNELSREIFDHYQVRKTKTQKLAFIERMKQHYPELQIEEGGLFHSRNLIIGNVDTAKVICSAHYDTCARLPFPNMITPKNFLFFLCYNLLICIPFFLVLVICLGLLNLVSDAFLLNYWISCIIMFALLLYVFMFGKPNEHTANDNTSGVITLIELMDTLSEEERAQTAFVFFDNEENGLLGSSFFRRKHKDILNRILLFNFDCVSDGDHILLVQSKPVWKKHGILMKEAFPATGEKTAHLVKSSSTIYPSDQQGFPNHVAVASMKHKKWLGLYMDRIHTKRDTVFDERNLTYLCQSMKHFLQGFLQLS